MNTISFWHNVYYYVLRPWKWHKPDLDGNGYCRKCD